MFDPQKTDDRLGTLALTRLLVQQTTLPIIAAGGIMDGSGINACLSLGASAAQLGTAFIACPESSADPDHCSTLKGDAAGHTMMTVVFSGRPARALPNRFTALELNEQVRWLQVDIIYVPNLNVVEILSLLFWNKSMELILPAGCAQLPHRLSRQQGACCRCQGQWRGRFCCTVGWPGRPTDAPNGRH